MEKLVIGKSIRSIVMRDFIAFVLDGILQVRKATDMDEHLFSPERIDNYAMILLKKNKIQSTMDIRGYTTEQYREKISDESIKEIYLIVFESEDYEDFRDSFFSELNNTFGLIDQFAGGKEVEASLKNQGIAIMLRLIFEFYRRVMEIIDNKEDTKSYIFGLKVANSLNVPVTYEEYEENSKKYHIFFTIQKQIEHLNIPENLQDSETMMYCIYFPMYQKIEKEVELFLDMGFTGNELEDRIRGLKDKYLSFEIVNYFTNLSNQLELVRALCPNDIYRENIKIVLSNWAEEIEPKRKAFHEFIEEKIEELKKKKLKFGDNVLSVILSMFSMIDDRKGDDEVSDKIGKVFVRIYQNILNNYHLEVDDKMTKLDEISKIKKEICSIAKVSEIKNTFRSLSEKTVNIEKLFLENYFQKKPINYLLILFIAYKKSNYDFLKKVVTDKTENRLLRNFSRDLMYKRLQEGSVKNNPESFKRSKDIFREFFDLIHSDSELLEYKKEMLNYLIKLVSQNSKAPYENFYNEITDIFISTSNRIMDPALFTKKLNGKILKANEKDNLELCAYYIQNELYNKMITQLEKAGQAKEAIKRKIDLRFGNDYKAVESKFYRMEKKLLEN